MNKWQKIPYSGKGKVPPHWLEYKERRSEIVYRVIYRADGCDIRKTLVGNFKKWEDAFSQAERLIASIRFDGKKKNKNFVTCEDLISEIIEMKKSMAIGTYKKTEIYYRVHILPFLQEYCAYASDLNNSVWKKYKHQYRMKYPDRPLFEHWKYFSQLFTLAKERGLVDSASLDFNEKKEDNRKKGQVIPDQDFKAFLKHACEDWRDRAIIQTLTGQRPGVIRVLKKEYVDFNKSEISIPKEVSKNREEYSFKFSGAVSRILKKRLENGSAYFFPGLNKEKPTDRQLNSWHRAWKRAGIEKGFTPHDLRHTYITRMIKAPGTNLPILAHSCDLSLQLLLDVYAHIIGNDTEQISEIAEKATQGIIGDAS